MTENGVSNDTELEFVQFLIGRGDLDKAIARLDKREQQLRETNTGQKLLVEIPQLREQINQAMRDKSAQEAKA